MPVPTPQQLKTLGPAVLPFERRGFAFEVKKGEDIDFKHFLFDATEDGKPLDVVEVDPSSIENDPKNGRYLWVITAKGMHLILEATPNPEAARQVVCHSNITAGKKALQGGELWFGIDHTVYINYRSGRFGAVTEQHMQAVVEYFYYVNYKRVVVVD